MAIGLWPLHEMHRILIGGCVAMKILLLHQSIETMRRGLGKNLDCLFD